MKLLAHCLNGDETPFVVSYDFGGTCYIHSPKMELLLSIKTSMKPQSFFAVSKKGLFLVSERGTIGYIDLEKKKYSTVKCPTGKTFGENIGLASVFEVEEGFYLSVCDFVKKKSSFFYSYSTNAFEAVDISLPENCFSYGAGKHGAFFYLDKEGNFHASSFKTTYEKKQFVPELTFGKDIISGCLDYRGITSLFHQVVYLSLEKKSMVMLSPVKADTSAYAEYVNDVLSGKSVPSKAPEMKTAYKLTLFKDDGIEKELVLDGVACKTTIKPFSDSAFAIKHGRALEAYRSDDLTLLVASQNEGYGCGLYVLPDGRSIPMDRGELMVYDPSPFTLTFK